jgi:PQQ-dependent dehydrogenase (s-GDH family)
MKPLIFALACASCIAQQVCAQTSPDSFSVHTTICELSQPWEVHYGDDDHLWVTESYAYRVARIDPTTGQSEIVLDAANLKNWTWGQYPLPQSGFSGLAMHPQFLQGKPYVYLGYTYQFDGCGPNNTNCLFKTKVVRYSYDFAAHLLVNPETLVDTIPGSSDHNGGRLTIGPINGTDYLIYSVGDMGAGQFSNADRPNHAQEPSSYEGKILRFNLTPDNDANWSDSWIPNDNPFNGAQQSAVWSIGHRNPQGLAFGKNGTLYEMEHGPYSDDELNIINPGSNYGHPLLSGFADGNYNTSKVGAGTVPWIFSEQINAAMIGATYRDPIATFWPAPADTVHTIHSNVEQYFEPYPNYYLSWPTIAPSGIAYYGSDSIPGWKNSILVACLKRAVVYRLQLNADGTQTVGDTIGIMHQMGRFRDVAISKDGKSIFIACDSIGPTSGPTLGTSLVPQNRGCILEYRYHPPVVISGVDAVEKEVNLTILPNPAHQFVQIAVDDPRISQIKITNQLGQEVHTMRGTELGTKPLYLDIAQWPAGMYHVRCLAGNTVVADRKLVVDE